MPDKNKMQALRDAGFCVLQTCSLCGYFIKGANGWGTCKAISYQHLKHTGDIRFASVPNQGHCNRFVEFASEVGKLGAHQEFFNDLS